MADTNTITDITSLPTELVQAISQNVDRSDILDLRLTCRDTSAKVDDVFVDTFFTERYHLITNYSFNALVQICRTPRLTRKLRELHFLYAELSDRYEPEDAPVANAEAWLGLMRGSEAEFTDEYKRDIVRANDLSEMVWSKWLAERKHWHEDGLAVELISQALRNLASAGVFAALCICSDPCMVDESAGPYGLSRLQRDLGFSAVREFYGDPEESLTKSLSPWPQPDETTSGLLKAVSLSEYPAPNLVLLGGADPGTFASFDLEQPLLSGLTASFRHLKSLELSIHRMAQDWCPDGVAWSQKGLAKFGDLMEAATQLRSLKLNFSTDFYHHGAPAAEREMVALADVLPQNQL